LLAETKPEGAVETLLYYLPFAEDAAVEEISSALAALALKKGKLSPVLLKALEDPIPLRRSIAAEILCQVGGPEIQPDVRKLLSDPKPSVRLRAALALAQLQDVEAVVSLISLLGELPEEQTRQAEDYLTKLAEGWEIRGPRGDGNVSRRLRREAWAAWWKATEGSFLLHEFTKRTLSDTDRDNGLALIAKLNNPGSHDQAVDDLSALGNGVIPVLRQAVNSADGKDHDRLQKCLKRIDKGALPPLPLVAARLVGLRRPEGAADVFLAYLPQAEDDAMAEEVRLALVSVAERDGKAEPALVNALKDKLPLRRMIAAEILCRVKDTNAKNAAYQLLEDKDWSVRLRVARAVLANADKKGIPVLINLLTCANKEQANLIHGELCRIAEDKAPSESVGDKETDRRKCQTAWEKWWKENENNIELALAWGRQKPPSGYGLDFAHPITRNLIACWPLNEGVGTVARDLSVSRRNATFGGAANAVTWVSTVAGRAIATKNNAAAGLNAGQSAIYSVAAPTESLSGFAIVIPSPPFVNMSPIFSKRDDAKLNEWGLYVNPALKLNLVWYEKTSVPPRVNLTSKGSLTPNTYNTIGFTFDGTTAKLYLNGVVDTSTTVAPFNYFSAALPFVIAGEPLQGKRGFAGKTLLLMVWKNRILTAQDFRGLHNRPYDCFQRQCR
jgi:HEAT repeat protein